MTNEEIIDGVKEAGRRSAWIRVFNGSNEHNRIDFAADSVVADLSLLKLNWCDKDATIIHKYFCYRENEDESRNEAWLAIDRGKLNFSELVDIFFTAKEAELYKIRNNE